MNVFANVVIPSIAGHVIVMVILLVPIAWIESLVLALRHELPYGTALGLSFVANLKSTVIGLPIGYALALLGIIPAGVFASFLPERIKSVIGVILMNALAYGGTVPTNVDELGFCLGTLLMMIPYFLVTLRLERQAIVKLRPDLDTARLTTTVRIMHDITYGLLAIPLVIAGVQFIVH